MKKKITYNKISYNIYKITSNKVNLYWYYIFFISCIASIIGNLCIIYTIYNGIGTWGLNKTINWAWDITNFVWWVGIGHAGTFISSVLLLFEQNWRISINRAAETMTIFAIIQAGLFPIIHMGRIWHAFWVLPISSHLGKIGPNFYSPLLWDVFAISTYLSVSLIFWYISLIPDISIFKNITKNKFKKILYTLLSLGWNGNILQWKMLEKISIILSSLCTPLVFSVHTIVSFDFATSIVKGWHSTIFPPYFVAGAIFSGFAMVQILICIIKKTLKLNNYIKKYHIECINYIILITNTIMSLSYFIEFITPLYYNDIFDKHTYMSKYSAFGPNKYSFWTLIICNVIIPQLLWIKYIRCNEFISCLISIFINIGMWYERYNIIVLNLSRDYLPSTWIGFSPSYIDIGIFAGTFGTFISLYLLFIKYFPIISLSEIKSDINFYNK